jgi:hypothetical protein
MSAAIIGIDLGLGGALAALSPDGQLLDLRDMPTVRLSPSRRDYDLAALAAWLDQQPARAIGIEYVHPMPRRLGGAIASFWLGRASGLIEMYAQLRRVHLECLPPHTWQRWMIPIRRGGSPKRAACLAAQRLFPSAPIGARHGRADALLIAEFTRRLTVPAAGSPLAAPAAPAQRAGAR